jgi:hypothetical protein
MSTASRPYPIVQDLIESFAGWLKHRREMDEMRQLDRDLAAGTAAENYHGYCANAATLESLDRAEIAKH